MTTGRSVSALRETGTLDDDLGWTSNLCSVAEVVEVAGSNQPITPIVPGSGNNQLQKTCCTSAGYASRISLHLKLTSHWFLPFAAAHGVIKHNQGVSKSNFKAYRKFIQEMVEIYLLFNRSRTDRNNDNTERMITPTRYLFNILFVIANGLFTTISGLFTTILMYMWIRL